LGRGGFLIFSQLLTHYVGDWDLVAASSYCLVQWQRSFLKRLSLEFPERVRALNPRNAKQQSSPSPLGMCLAPSQSQRDCVLQPRVARNELPWVGGPLNPNPERVPPQTLNTNPPREERAGERRPFPEWQLRGDEAVRIEISLSQHQCRGFTKIQRRSIVPQAFFTDSCSTQTPHLINTLLQQGDP